MPGTNPSPAAVAVPSLPTLSFLPAVTVDPVRIASEPSVTVEKDGTILVSAPTGTVKYATRPQDLLVEAPRGAFQSALWMSKDGGKTFQFVNLDGILPYHGVEPGGGDSALAIDAKGTVYMNDQIGLAAEAVSESTDGGKTWNRGTPLGAGTVDTDRAWMIPDPTTPGTVYLVVDHTGVDIVVAKTTDGGATWAAHDSGAPSTSPGPIVAAKGLVAFSYFGQNQVNFVASYDQGSTWKQTTIAKGTIGDDHFPQTLIDQNGTLYVAWTDKGGIGYARSHDMGHTWSAPSILVPLNTTHTFLWGVAGAGGRLGFSWYDAKDSQGQWFETAAIVTGADSANPQYVVSRVSDVPARTGPPCDQGTACTSGREFGDFQSCAITPDGDLVVAYNHVISAQAGALVAFDRVASATKLWTAAPTPWVT
jgi:hypothetical protein